MTDKAKLIEDIIGFCESELIDPSRSPDRGVSNAEAEAYFTGYEAAVEHIRDFASLRGRTA